MFWRRRAGKVYTALSLSCASARPPEHVRQMYQALEQSPESDEQRGFALLSLLLTLKSPTHSLILHFLHNNSTHLPCLRKQSALSSQQHASSPCLGMSK
jgi:hypothetical protein